MTRSASVAAKGARRRSTVAVASMGPFGIARRRIVRPEASSICASETTSACSGPALLRHDSGYRLASGPRPHHHHIRSSPCYVFIPHESRRHRSSRKGYARLTVSDAIERDVDLGWCETSKCTIGRDERPRSSRRGKHDPKTSRSVIVVGMIALALMSSPGA